MSIALPLLYEFRNLRVRSSRTLLTMLTVALVVGVFCYLLCFADGLCRALARTGDPQNLIVIAEPATAESNSAISHEDVPRLKGLAHVAVDAGGRPLVSPEYVVQTNVTRRDDDSGAGVSVTLRGVDLGVALPVHPQVALTAGRWFRAGTDELVVGHAATRQFTHTTIGSTLDCGDRTFTIVGVFRAGGGVRESEFWGHFANVADAYRRSMFSSATVRLNSADPALTAVAVERIASAAIALRGLPEPAYFATQTQNARVLQGLATTLVLIMGTGAVFAAMNTMYASVVGRTREIGMLRAIGFSRTSVRLGILAQSLALALTGGLIGCLACAAMILLDHSTKDLVGTTTFTSVAFTVGLSGANLLLSLAVAALMGLCGGLWPARAASRLSVVQALRTE